MCGWGKRVQGTKAEQHAAPSRHSSHSPGQPGHTHLSPAKAGGGGDFTRELDLGEHGALQTRGAVRFEQV